MDMDPGSPGIVVSLLVIVAEVFVAMVTIIFFLSVTLRDFHIRKKLESKDQILLALKVSSFIFTIVMSDSAFPNILQPDFSRMSHPSPLFTVSIVYCMCSCTWLIALLCFFYFIKIVPFQWAFISWVKRIMDSSTSWQIVGVEVMSMSIGLLHLLLYRTEYVSSTNSSDVSSTYSTTGHMTVCDSVTYLLLIVVCPSFVLSTIATLVTAAFLKCHANKMKDTNTTGDVHQYIHVVQTMLLYLFLYSVFYVMLFLYYFSFFSLFSIGYWINLILVFLFMPTINVLQIYKTPHLRTTWMEMISYFILCRKPDTQ